MTQGLLLNPSKQISKSIKHLFRTAKITISETDSESEFWDLLRSKKPDIILVHVEDQSNNSLKHYKSLFVRMQSEGTWKPVVLLVEPKKSEGGHVLWKQWQKAFDKINPIDVIPFHKNKIDKAETEELRFRALRLLNICETFYKKEKTVRSSETKWTGSAISKHLFPKLHNPKSGRIDAEQVSELFGISLTLLADILQKNVQTVHKTPDAPALQDKLSQLEKIAVSLMELTGSEENLRSWFKASNPDLEGESPLSIIEKRHMEVVLQMLEDALLGQPT
jgi:hypothetical protein